VLPSDALLHHFTMATLRISKKAKKATKTTKKAPTKKVPTKKARVPKKRATKNRPTLSRAQTPKERTDAIIATIRERIRDNRSSAHAIGRALISLRDPSLWVLYGETSFKGFVNEQIMPHSSALRFISLAESYDESVALEIGVERGIQLARVARLKKLGPPQALWERNAVLVKKPQRRVRDMSAAELDRVARGALLQKAKQRLPSASDREREVFEGIKERFGKFFELDAKWELDTKDRKIRMELDLDDAL